MHLQSRVRCSARYLPCVRSQMLPNREICAQDNDLVMRAGEITVALKPQARGRKLSTFGKAPMLQRSRAMFCHLLLPVVVGEYLIAEAGNNRVQLCSSTLPGTPCTTVAGTGVAGSTATELSVPVSVESPTATTTEFRSALFRCLAHLARLWRGWTGKGQARDNFPVPTQQQ